MLTDKIAVVTGASRGIGREIAVTLAAKGAVVIVNYNGTAARAEEVVKGIEEAGGRAEAVQCNVSEYDLSLIHIFHEITSGVIILTSISYFS